MGGPHGPWELKTPNHDLESTIACQKPVSLLLRDADADVSLVGEPGSRKEQEVSLHQTSQQFYNPVVRWRFLVVVVWMLVMSNGSRGEACLYGLYAPTADMCRALEKVSLVRVGSAKTICFSANSEVLWNKNNKQPVGTFAIMRSSARVAMKRFTALYACDRADLVIKIVYPETSGLIPTTRV
jgi:hypothetical protein